MSFFKTANAYHNVRTFQLKPWLLYGERSHRYFPSEGRIQLSALRVPCEVKYVRCRRRAHCGTSATGVTSVYFYPPGELLLTKRIPFPLALLLTIKTESLCRVVSAHRDQHLREHAPATGCVHVSACWHETEKEVELQAIENLRDFLPLPTFNQADHHTYKYF